MTKQPPDLADVILSGLKSECPKCKTLGIYKGRFSLELKDKCDSCDFPLAENDAGDGPAVFIIFILSFSVIPLALVVESVWGWSTITHIVIWSVVILGLTVGFLKPAKGLTLALQYRHLPETMEHTKRKKD